MKKTAFSSDIAARTCLPLAQSAALSGIPRLPLAGVRAFSGMTQVDLAAKLGIHQKNVSKLESRDDMKLSTLKNYFESMGVEFEILTRVKGKVVLLDLLAPQENEKTAAQATPFD